MKKKLFNALEGVSANSNRLDLYDTAMVVVILLSIMPLMFKQKYQWLNIIDLGASVVFVLDYFLRWCTADLKHKKGKLSFILYPFTIGAIIDLLAIIPVFSLFVSGLDFLHFARILKGLCIMRTLKILRYSSCCQIIRKTLYQQRHALCSAYIFAIFYVFVSALIIFNIEPQTFNTFLDAIYWAVVSLTTVGYGDIYPVSGVGRVVTVLSAFVGISIIALPAGIITAGYMRELENFNKNNSTEKPSSKI
ncbi:MAG: potassium channel family protein [Lentisphaeria bacterium]|nr:potassium channel family protein [Lentisphaeria bacterium]